jgi:hypothetical protein
VCLSGFALLLIEPLTIIHDATNWRITRRSNFHKIQPNLTRSAKCLFCVDNTNLIVRFIN